MSAPYMQLYVADYLGDTRHLTTEQHGAYLLLLMTMWRSDGVLSDDPSKLARIAGLTVARWKKISDDVLAFFTPCEGGLTQARLVAELTIADEKSEKRSQAGKAGSRAKALKDKKAGVANAKRSSWHSPEPEPKEPPSPLSGEPISLARFSKALAVTADAGCAYQTMVERVHKAQPLCEGRRKSALVDVDRALGGALKRGGMPSAIWAAVQNFYALPASTKDGGQFANGAAVVLNKDRWKEFASPAVGSASASIAAPTFNAPQVRASIVQATDEDFARRYVDHYCRWEAEGRRLVALRPSVAAALTGALSGWAERTKVTISVEAANDPSAPPAQEAAA